MKEHKKRRLGVFLALLVLLTAVCSCTESEPVPDYTFRSVDPQEILNSSHCDIKLEKITYSDSSFTATVSGSLFVPSAEGYEKKELKSETIAFSQEYGTVWKGELHDTDGQPVEIFLVRHGENMISDSSKLLTYTDYSTTASLYEKYGEPMYLFLGKYEYLIFEKR